MKPSWNPSGRPSRVPSIKPTRMPSNSPSSHPSDIPSILFSAWPSVAPSKIPSYNPTKCNWAGITCNGKFKVKQFHFVILTSITQTQIIAIFFDLRKDSLCVTRRSWRVCNLLPRPWRTPCLLTMVKIYLAKDTAYSLLSFILFLVSSFIFCGRSRWQVGSDSGNRE